HSSLTDFTHRSAYAFTSEREGTITMLRTGRTQVMEALRDSEARFRQLNKGLELRVAERAYELTESREQLRALAAELTLAEHRERTRLATELHDHLAQLLTYGCLKLAQARKVVGLIPTCAGFIKDLEEVLTGSLADSRTLISQASLWTVTVFRRRSVFTKDNWSWYQKR
ncbi:MAG: histidine kinase, partial [Nitrospirales bacterium]